MKKYRCIFIVLLFVNSLAAVAGTAQQLFIETKNTLLVFTVGTNGKLYQSYFGQKPGHRADRELLQSTRHEAYIGAGMGDLFEPAIRMVHADGNPSLDLVYAGHKTEKKGDDLSLTTITLKDPKYPVEVLLRFSAYFKDDVLKTWTEISHQEKKAVVLSNYASSMLHFEASKYWLSQFDGDYMTEMRMKESLLTS